MAKASTKFDYLTRYIIDAIERGDYVHSPFPSERALAEEAGMSLTTVRKAVALCLEKGYLTRNETSRQPEVHRNFLKDVYEKHVAVILPGILSQATAEWYSPIENFCSKNRFSINMISYHGKDDPTLIKHLNGEPYDLIFFFPPPSPPPLLLKQMQKNAYRLVTFFHDYTRYGITTLCDPPRGLTGKMLEYLRQLNCRTVDCLNAGRLPNRMIENQISDWQAFLSRTKCSGMLIDCEQEEEAAPHYELARKAIRDHLRKHRLPDAFLCTTGMAAVGTVRGLADCSLRAGLDVKVLAISSNPLLKNVTPSITSMEPPPKEALIEEAFKIPRPLRIEHNDAKLFIGESTELLPRIAPEK